MIYLVALWIRQARVRICTNVRHRHGRLLFAIGSDLDSTGECQNKGLTDIARANSIIFCNYYIFARIGTIYML